ncbi:MAG: DUF4129 domain-containing transglutaminase family protein [Thermomicrobiales bacterium]
MPTTDARTRTMFPEGIATFLLLIGLVACASRSVQAGGWERVVIPATVVGVGAALLGSLLAKLNVLDSIAHFFSMVVGLSVSFYLVLLQADELAPGLRDRVRPLAKLIADWYIGGGRANGHETYLVSILMGIIVWLVGYLAAWILFRRGWLLAALLLPGLLVLLNLLYAPDSNTRYLAIYLLLAIPLAARYRFYSRQQDWHRRRIPATASGATRILIIGMVIGIVITTAGWQAPSSFSQQAFQPLAQQMTTQVSEIQARISSLLDPATSGIGTGSGGSYSSFSDSFSVGGALELSNTPEVLVRSSTAPYLAAQRYDIYSGRGWSSDIDETFDGKTANGQSYSPAMTFKANQHVMVSPDVLGARSESSADITQLTARDRTIFTIDTYLTASIDTSVQMSWRRLSDQPFPLSRSSISSLPPDLQRLATMLLTYRLDGSIGDRGPQPSISADASLLTQEAAQLKDRFLDVRWTVGADGEADTLYVSGQIPVYDDVETVRGRAAGQQGLNYVVDGLSSSASAEELSAAGIEYPTWVTDRYLGLPDSVTSRTRDLAMEIAPANVSPYERAVAIETWLRSNITYDEKVSAPPSGADMVDYLLFERRSGYCEYSASAMAVMLRAVNVPARVVTGYYPGDYDQQQNGFVYLQKNAHAWVEAFFPWYGWIQFEPTSSQPTVDHGDGQKSEIQRTEAQPTPTSTMAADEAALPTATPDLLDPAANGQQPPQLDRIGGGNGSSGRLLIAGAIAAAFVFTGGVLWIMWNWSLRGLSPSSSLYMRLLRFGRFAGIRPSSTATPHEVAESFAKSVPAVRMQAERIVHVYELDQYGPDGADSGLLRSAIDAWRGVRANFMRVILRRRR